MKITVKGLAFAKFPVNDSYGDKGGVGRRNKEGVGWGGERRGEGRGHRRGRGGKGLARRRCSVM